MCRIAIESMVWTAIDTGTLNETRVGAVSTRSHDPLGVTGRDGGVLIDDLNSN